MQTDDVPARGARPLPSDDRPGPRETEGGRQLARTLQARGLSWAEGSRLLERHPSYLRKIIVGVRQPTAAMRARIQSTFGVLASDWRRAPRQPVRRRPSGPVPARGRA